MVAFGAAVLAGCSGTARRTAQERPPAPPPAAPLVHQAKAPRPMAAPDAPTRADAPPNPCAHNTGGQLVRVSLKHQRMWLCTHHRLAYDSAITSGIVGQYTSTPTGDYAIQGLDRNTVLTLITGQQYDVKYWIPFDAPLFGFHDAPWQQFPYGSPKYRTEGSHGCVHLPLKAIRYLYNWAEVGTRVQIRA